MFLSFVIWAMSTYDKQQFGVCGKTVQSCRRNVITPLLPVLKGLGMNIKESITEKSLTIDFMGHRNTFYIFGGKDESSASLIQGITLAGIFFDEVVLQPKSFVEQGLGRCSVAGSKYWFNCNPDSPMHWFYLEWIEKREEKHALYLHFTQDDNPSLSQEIKERYQRNYSGMFYDRFILGKWVKAEGLVYPMFNDENLFDDDSTPVGEYYVSCDYGVQNAFSAGLWRIYGGKAWRIREYYYDGRKEGKQKTNDEYFEDLDKFIDGINIQCIIIDPSAASFIETIRRNGKYSAVKAKNDVLGGIETTANLIQNRQLMFHRSCVNSQREFALYSWDSKAKEKDTVLKENDHAMDDIRYFVNNIMRRR